MHRLSDKNEVIQFRYIRITACLCIVLLHTLHASNDLFAGSMTLTDTLVTKSVQNLLLWCVPCFLMVTGALLLEPDREISIKKVFSKYVLRMVLALVMFTFLFRVLDMITNGENISFATLMKSWLTEMLTGQSWLPMWYLYLMIGIYAMIPVYRVIFSHASDAMLKYLTAVIMVFVSLVPLSGIMGIDLHFYIPTTMIYPVYIFLGRMIYTGQLKVSRHFAVILTVGCSIILVMLTYFKYMYGDITFSEGEMDSFNRMLLGYSSILTVGQSVGIFALMCGIRVKSKEASGLLLSLDKCTFGIYLTHMIFVMIVMKVLMVDPYQYGGAWLFAAMTGAFFTAGFVVTFVLRMVPGMKRVL